MAKHLTILMLALLTACSSNSDSVTMLATRLAHQDSVGLSKEYRDGYIPCGVKTLSKVPSKKIDAALEAPDVSAIWEILGSDTLDAYVKACRQTDLQRGPSLKT
ncbi:hypothetical protein [Sphingopyxis terrae]|uniref:hypothetical protein n=1 Tax=Sphingopyxis terrae TaxID=33052 RepID=UPI000A6DF92C|nr:hypothetical protein [Sphingopyxis terrae]